MKERYPGDSKTYNQIIQHETIRVAVCEQLEEQFKGPEQLLQAMRSSFHDFYDHYVSVCEKHMDMDGERMIVSFISLSF